MGLRVMTEQDISGGLRLNTLSGWNQTAADWRRFLENGPRGCFVMDHDRKVVGTATTICYENRFAWIGMVLVDPKHRKQGIGTALLKKAIAYLDSLHIATIKLDATPQGKPIYAKLGFVEEYEIERWILERPLGAISTTPASTCAPLNEMQGEQIFRLDKELFGADRSFLLRALCEEAPGFAMAVWEEELLQGYAFGRRGLFADHLGPWMARTRAAGEKILREFLAKSSRETAIVDCMKSNSVAVELLRGGGFAPSRPLTRMVRGPNAYPGGPEPFCAILGPEFG
ncbi:MAG TPA: GNAT family N-acetyltransferase [Candidatus Acidoferrum sp.]|nr:GNAT family N-acetyltransferase [Candidatus Acidoferrum sp.]